MGDWSVVCAVTGLPITNSQEVVGFEVEPYRFDATRHRWIPKTWPVFGQYDMGGGIEGHELSPNSALIHLAVWNNAENYWHSENRKCGANFLNISRIVENAKKEETSTKMIESIRDRSGEPKRYSWTPNDFIFYALEHSLQDSDEGLVLKDLMDAKKLVGDIPEDHCFLHRGAFAETLCDRIRNGWSASDRETLYKLVCMYSAQMITGRQISPSSHPYIEQYPDYKQRIKSLRFTLDLARKLEKDRNAR